MRTLCSWFVLFSLVVCSQCSKDTGVSYEKTHDGNGVIERPYLGQSPPGQTPQIFAPGIIPHGTLGITFTPVLAHFSGTNDDLESHIIPDGSRLYFGSRRFLDGVFPDFLQLWYVDKSDSGWSQPMAMDPPLRGLREQRLLGGCGHYRRFEADGDALVENINKEMKHWRFNFVI